jgi:organic radical activating enzyme
MNEIKCTAGTDYCYIDWKGDLFKCNAHSVFGDKYKIASIRNVNNITKFLFRVSPICKNYCCTDICDKLLTQQWENDKKIVEGPWITWEYSKSIEEAKEKRNFHIHAEIVSGCINKCVYCSVYKTRNFNFKFIEKNHWIDFFKYINLVNMDYGDRVFSVAGGGEPLAHPDFCEIINHALDNNYRTNITTSGLNYPSRLKNIQNLEKLNITLSLHPLSPLWDQSKIEDLVSHFKDKNIMTLTCNLVTHPENMKHYDNLNNMLSKYNVYLRKFEYDPDH